MIFQWQFFELKSISRITYVEINEITRIAIKILKSYNWKTYKSFMNYLFPRFNCFCKFSRSHFKRNYEYIDVSSIFYFFSFVGFLIETSGNSISFLAVIIVDVLLVYFNYDKCYNNECIYYEHSHCITFFRRCIHWVNLNCHTRLLYAKNILD